MTPIHSPIYSHFPLRSTASPLDSHLSSSLLPQPSPHRHHVYSILLTAPLSSRAFPTSTFPPPHSCSHFYLSSPPRLLLTPFTQLSVPPCRTRSAPPSHTNLDISPHHFCHNRRRTVITSTAYHLTPSFSTTPFLAINSPPFHISENSTVRGSSSTGLFAGFLADISIVRRFFDGRAPKENKSS